MSSRLTRQTKPAPPSLPTPDSPSDAEYTALLRDIKSRIREAQHAALKAVNTQLIGVYWDIGRLIVERQRGETWGKAVVAQLASDLRRESSGMDGFSASNLWRMKLFYETYATNEKLAPVVREIAWSHNLVILERCTNDLEREFYLKMTRKFGWSKRTLMAKIDSQTFRRIFASQSNFDAVLHAQASTELRAALKDEYTFDFLDLADEHSERELVPVELKRGDFIPEYVGKMQFYLAALDDFVRQPGEHPSIGIILCKSRNKVVVEYALRESRRPIGVAGYRTVSELPDELEPHFPSAEQLERLLG